MRGDEARPVGAASVDQVAASLASRNVTGVATEERVAQIAQVADAARLGQELGQDRRDWQAERMFLVYLCRWVVARLDEQASNKRDKGET